MKTPNLFRIVAMLIALTGLTLSSCQKDKLETGTNDSSSLIQLSADESTLEDISNEAMQDVEGVLSYNGGNLKSTDRIPCNATVDSTSMINDTITIYITYDGLSCNGRRYRTGQVQIKKQVGTHWGMEGASVNVKYINFSVTRVGSGITVVLNSNKTFTNVSGGFIYMLGQNGFTALVHRVEGSMSVTFDNGTTRLWNVARQRTYTGTPGELLLTIDGFGNAGEYSNLVTWGANRQGEEFYTQINQSLVHREACEWDPASGIKIHQIPALDKSATITFGYDSNNEPITGDDCPTHYRIDWQNGTFSGTRFLPLP
ncbi:MAG: hypothetical protein RBS07_00625 [Lentimicrobium sp.]|jgi:hypothetical protein|nr:hypothetical protein [Lentimicrobium sp.]